MLLVVSPLFLHAKQLLKKLLFENQKNYANLLLGLTLANYTPTRCVNPCRLNIIRVGNSIQRRVYLLFDKTGPEVPIFNEQVQHVKMNGSLQQANRGKLTASVMMVFFSLEHCV